LRAAFNHLLAARMQREAVGELRRDRDQLWAEAAVREAAGESIRLKEELWPVASAEQAQRLRTDAYEEALRTHIGHIERGKISSESIWIILDVKTGNRDPDKTERVGAAMRTLGWERANSAGTIKMRGKNMPGWVKGDAPRPGYEAIRCNNQVSILPVRERERPDLHVV
jgi:predicted P-loop ATPase